MLIVVTSLMLLLLAAVVYAYFALKSGDLSQQAVPKLAPYLKPLGIELQHLDSAHIDLLRSVDLRNVSLKWRDSPQREVQFTAGRFEADYDLPALLLHRLEVDHVVLQDAQFTVRLRTSTGSQPSAAEEPVDLEQVSELLRSPSLFVLAKTISIINVTLDVIIEQQAVNGSQTLTYKGVLQQADMELLWRENLLKGKFQIALGQNNQSTLTATQTRQEQTLELQGAPEINAQASWEFVYNDDQWKLQNATMRSNTKVTPMALYQVTNGEKRQVGSLTSSELDFDARANTVPGKQSAQKAASGGLAGVFPLAVSASVRSAINDLKLDQVKQADAQLSLDANQRTYFNVEGELDPMQRVFKGFQLQADQSLSISGLDARFDGQHLATKNLLLQFDGKAGTNGNAQNTLPLDFSINIQGQAQQLTVQQEAAADGGQALQAHMRPKWQFSATGQLQPFAEALQGLTVDFSPQLTVEDTMVQFGEGAGQQAYSVGRQQLTAIGKYSQGAFSADGDVNLERVSLTKKAKRFSLKNHFKVTSDTGLAQIKTSLESVLDKQRILALSLTLDNNQQQLTAQHSLQFDLPKDWQVYFPAAEDVRLPGRFRINWTAKTELHHGANSVVNADFIGFDQWPVNAGGKFILTQLERPKKSSLVIEQPITIGYDLSKGNHYQLALHADAPGLLVSTLKAPLPLQVDLQSRFTWPLTVSTASAQIDVAGEKALQIDLDMNDQPKHASINSHWSVMVQPQWQQYADELKGLELIGQIASNWQLVADIRHENNSIAELDPALLEKATANINLDSDVQQLNSGPKAVIHLTKPLKITQQLDWSKAGIVWQSQFSVAAAEFVQQAALQELSGNMRLHASPGDAPKQASLTVHVNKSGLQLIQDTSEVSHFEIGQLLTPLDLQISGAMQKEQMVMDKMELKAGNGLFAFNSSGIAGIDGQNAQFESSLKVQLRPQLLSQPTVSGAGTLAIPRLLTMKQGGQVTVDGELQFTDLDVAVDEFQVLGLNGHIKLNEELTVTPQQTVKFRYLVQTDPFQRVDFTRIQPYLDNPSLRIQNITIAGKSFGPALASISLKQNILRLARFDLDLFGGHLSGQFYADTRPQAWKIGLLGRLSQLDPRRLLPDPAASKLNDYSPVSARIAVEFDINQRLVEGRVDMTQISREQLMQLLEIVDPEHSDEQVAQVRSALRLAYPKWVTLDMGQGLMDLEVAISSLPKTIKVHGLPLTPLIQHFAGDTLDDLGQLPLQQ